MDAWPYVLVFLAAATPLLEVLFVIPPSIASGLNPVLVGAAAFLGNALALTVVVLFADHLAAWLQRRRGDAPPSKRRRRLQRTASRWGLPGVAVLAPLTIGTHLAALAAVALRLSRAAVLAWMVAGLAAWSVAITVASSLGFT
jgi:Ca2+/H+ antiporter, TMEM165/GDT1 family